MKFKDLDENFKGRGCFLWRISSCVETVGVAVFKMYSTIGFAFNGIFALIWALITFPIYTLLNSLYGSRKIDQSDLRKHVAIVTGGNTGEIFTIK